MDPAIQCLTGSHHALCGPACTVKVFPGDNLMVHKVLDVAKPGDIVVVDAGGSTQNAVLGDLISTKAQHRQIAGFIVDGLIRDLPAILPLDFPVFARGVTPDRTTPPRAGRDQLPDRLRRRRRQPRRPRRRGRGRDHRHSPGNRARSCLGGSISTRRRIGRT